MPLNVGIPPLRSTVVATFLGQNPGGIYQPQRIVIDEHFPVVLGVGQSRFNHIHVMDSEVAKRHCELRWDEHGIAVVHLSSVGQTLVNDDPVDVHVLEVGDVIRIGRHLRLHFEHVIDAEFKDIDPLIAPVLAAPEDLELRLVVGDRLCERNDPRGELIQLQAALIRLGEGDERIPRLESRVRELLNEHEATWIAPLTVPIESWTFRYGFLDEVRVRSLSEFELRRVELTRFHPIRDVCPL